MDIDQLEKKLAWLDDERRREHESLEAIAKRLSEVEDDLEARDKRMEEVGSEMARLSALATAVSQFEDALHKHRQEISRQLEDGRQRQALHGKQAEELRRSDNDALNKRVTELRAEIDNLRTLEQALENRRKEEVKLVRKLDSIDKSLNDQLERTTDASRALNTIEEARRTDAKRMAEFQAEISNLRNLLENLRGAQDVFDDRSRRLETHVAELKATEAERKETLDVWSENQSRKLADFERGWNTWEDRFAAFEKKANEIDERMVQYEEIFLSTKQLQSELESTLERLERRIHEVGEIQRLGEDRQKQEWSVFLADEQKRWNTFKLTNEEQWREHDRLHERIGSTIGELETESEHAREEREALVSGIANRVKGLLRLARDWTDDLET